MSLFDYLNSTDPSNASTSSAASLLQQIAAQRGITVPAATLNALGEDTAATTGNASSVQISLSAQRAGAESDDAKKDAATVASNARAALDKNGASATGAMSGRALAIVALNQDGTFSRTEVDAAKTELRERDRQSVLAFFNSGDVTASSLKAYGQQLLAARQSMSAEEQALRASDPDLR
jgi:hypothetical protein